MIRPVTAIFTLALLLAAGAASAEPEPAGLFEAEGLPVARVRLLGRVSPAAAAVIGIEEGEPVRFQAVREALRRLYRLGELEGVSVRAILADGRVTLEFTIQPQRFIGRVTVDGRPIRDPTPLLTSAGLVEGAPYNQHRVEQAAGRIRERFAVWGFPDARVNLTAGTGGGGDGPDTVDLSLAVAEGMPRLVCHASIIGRRNLPERRLRGIFTLAPGDRLDRERIDSLASAVLDRYRQEWFVRASAEVVTGERVAGLDIRLPDGCPADRTVVLRIDEGPRFDLTFTGSRLHSGEALRQRLRRFLDDRPGFPDEAIVRFGDDLQEECRRRGHHFARVSIGRPPAGPAAVERVAVTIDEGPAVRLRKIRFDGEPGVPVARLERTLDDFLYGRLDGRSQSELGRPDPFGIDSRGLPPGPARNRLAGYQTRDDGVPQTAGYRRIYHERTLKEFTDELRWFYQSEGYLQARIDQPRTSFNQNRTRADIVYRVAAGRRTDVTGISVASETGELPESAVLAALPWRIGRPYNPLLLDKARLAVRDLYRAEGFYYTAVAIEGRPAPDGSGMRLLVTVSERTRIRIKGVFIKGNRRTRREVIEGVLALQPGSRFTPERVRASVEHLMQLGVLKGADVSLEREEQAEEFKNLVVTVHERPPGLFEVSGGISTELGVRLSGLLLHRNLLGLALEGHMRLRVNHRLPFLMDAAFAELYRELPLIDRLEREAVVGIRYPWTFRLPFQLSSSLDLVHEREQQRSFGVDRNGLVAGLHLFPLRQLSISLLLDLTLTDAQRNRLFDEQSSAGVAPPDGRSLEIAPKLRLRLDGRDDLLNPSRGYLAQLRIEYLESLAGDLNLSLFRTEAQLAGYLPLDFVLPRLVYKLSLMAGAILSPWDNETPVDRRFYLGGRTSLRGFGEGQVYPDDLTGAEAGEIRASRAPSPGGNSYLVVRNELRVPLGGSFFAGLFMDTGSLWLRTSSFRLDLWNGFRNSVGAGLRYSTLVGDISLDGAFNTAREAALGEGRWKIYFSIGLF